MSAHTNGVPTLSQLAESGLITTWQTRPPPRTKRRCHFINLLWPYQRVNSPSKMGKKEKLVTIAATSLDSQFVFSPAISCSLPLCTVSTYGKGGWCISWRRSEVQIREREEGGMETQSVVMIPLVIYNQIRLRPCGSLLDYPSWEDCQVLTPPRFHPPTRCGCPPPPSRSPHRLLVSLLGNLQSHLRLSV